MTRVYTVSTTGISGENWVESLATRVIEKDTTSGYGKIVGEFTKQNINTLDSAVGIPESDIAGVTAGNQISGDDGGSGGGEQFNPKLMLMGLLGGVWVLYQSKD